MTMYITRALYGADQYDLQDVQYTEWETLRDAEKHVKWLRARGLKVEIYRLL